MTSVEQQGPVKNLFLGSLFSATGMILGGLLTLATGIVLGRWLGPDSFGIYSLALITISLTAGLGTVGFDNCIARFSSLYLGNGEIHRIRGLIRYGIVRVLFCSLGAAVVLFILLRAGLFHATRLAPLDQISILLLLGVPLYALQLALLQTVLGLQWVKSRIILEKILQPVFRLAFPFLVLLWVTQRTSAAAWSLVISALVVDFAGAILLWAKVRKLPKGFAIAPKEKRQWLAYALPFVFYSLQNFLWAGMGLDVFLVGALLSLHHAGIYAAALRLVPVLALARGAMDYNFGPRAGVLFGQSDFKSIGVLYRNTSTMALSWTLPIAVILAVFGRPIMRTLFGAGYEEGATVLALLIAGFVVDSATGCNSSLLSMSGRSGLVLANGVAGGLTLFLLAVLLIPRWGILGAGFAAACSITVVNALATFETWKLFGFHPFGASAAKVGAAGALVAAFGLAWKGWVFPLLQPGINGLVISVLVVLLLYFGLLFGIARSFRPLYLGQA